MLGSTYVKPHQNSFEKRKDSMPIPLSVKMSFQKFRPMSYPFT